MKAITRILFLFLLAAGFCAAQATHAAQATRPAQPFETAFNFDWLVANSGGCGCFSLRGVSESAAYRLTTHWAIVGQVGTAWQSNVQNSGFSLDFSRYLAGGRYTWAGEDRVSYFAQFLAGAAHQSGSGYTPETAFAFQPGAGLDVRLGHGVLFRPAEVDYLRSALPNGASNRQSTFRYSIGFVFRFGH